MTHGTMFPWGTISTKVSKVHNDAWHNVSMGHDKYQGI